MSPLLLAAALALAAPQDAAPLPAAGAPAAHPPHAPGDPWENFNRRMFKIQQWLDRKLLRPAALGYKHAVPKPLRDGLRNAFRNLNEPVVFLNFVLQHKVGKAAETAVRFVTNSTVGVAGLVDIAGRPGPNLPHRPNGFGDTLGFYGVKPGPYIFLPLVGPSDVRDFVGGQADGLVLPLAVGRPFDRWWFTIPEAVISGLDQRAEVDDELKSLFDSALDPYATLRSVYQQDRAGEIAGLKGGGDAVAPEDPLATPLADPAKGPAGAPGGPAELSDPLADPAAAPAKPTPKPSAAPELADPLADPAAAPAKPTPKPSAAPELADPLADPVATPR